MADTSSHSSLVRIKKAAQILGVSVDTVRRWEKRGIITSHRTPGKHRMFSVVELKKFQEERGFSIGEAARYLSLSPSELRRLEQRGLVFPARNTHGERVYSKELLDAYAASRAKQDIEQPPFATASPLPDPDIGFTTPSLQIPAHNQGREFFNQLSDDHEVPLLSTEQGTISRIALLSTPWFRHLSFAGGASLFGIGIIIFALFAFAIPLYSLFGSKYRENIPPDTISALSSINHTPGGGQRVLAVNTRDLDRYFEINVPAVFTDKAFFEEAEFTGLLTATGNVDVRGQTFLNTTEIGGPLTLKEDVDGRGVDVDLGTGTIRASNLVYSLQGQVGDLTLVPGEGISISGLTILNADRASVQNIFKNVKVGSTTIVADNNNDELMFVAGSNVTLTADVSGDKITIASIDTSKLTTFTLEGDSGSATISDGVNFKLEGGPGLATSVSSTTGTFTVGAGNGVVVNADSVGLDVVTTSTTTTTSTNSGLEVSSDGLRLLGGCTNGQILQWNSSTGVWACTANAGGSPTLQTVYDNDTDGTNATIALTTADDSIVFQNPSAAGTDSAFLLRLDQDTAGVIALDIDAENTTADIINVSAAPLTTGVALDISDANALTTGGIAVFQSNSSSTAVRNLVGIYNGNSAAANAVPLSITQSANGTSIYLTSSATTADAIWITGPATTTGNVISVPDADSLTTGTIANFVSNSSSTSTRTLTQITNDNTLATGATVLGIQQDAAQYGLSIDQNGNGVAFIIDSEATTADIIHASAATLTTGIALDISDANSLTTGLIAYFASNSSSTAVRDLVAIANTNTAATNTIPLDIQQAAAQIALNINQDGNGIALHIDSEATSANVIDVITPVTTTGTVLDISDADSLTTGFIANFVSNSSSTSTRTLTQITNDNTAATGATVLGIQQDAAQRALFLDQNGNAVALEIDSEATTANVIDVVAPTTTTGAVLDISDADSLTTGLIAYFASNSSSTATRNLVGIANTNTLATGARLLTLDQDANALSVLIDSEATTANVIDIESPTTTTGTVLDISNADALTTGSVANFWSNSSSTSTRNLVGIANTNTLATGARLLTLDQDANALSILIDSEATSTHVIDITAPVTTTGTVLDISDADSLTSGFIANFVSNSSSTSTRTLTQITNDNTLATGATVLGIQQDAAQRGLYIDQNGNGIALDIDSDATTTTIVDVSAASLTTGVALYIPDANALTTGSIAYFASNSSSASARNLVSIINDNTVASGVIALNIQQDADHTALYIGSAATTDHTITVDNPGNTTGYVLNISSADALTSGKLAYLASNSSSTATRDLVSIHNNNTLATGAVTLLLSQAANASSFTIDSEATTANVIDVLTPTTTTGVVLDISDANSLTTGAIAFFQSSSSSSAARNLVVVANTNTAATSATLLTLDQDADAGSIVIDSEATSDIIVSISAAPLTTGIALDIPDLDALTTGTGVRILSNSASTSTRTLTQITNDNTLATGATVLGIQQDAAQRAVFLDQNGNAVALEIDSEATSANVIDVTAPTTTTGNVIDIADANSLTTGSIAYFVSNSSSTAQRYLTVIGNANTAATDARLLLLDQDANSYSLVIDSESTTTDVVYITASTLTAGAAIDVLDLDALTTGKGLTIASGSEAISSGELLTTALTSSGSANTAKTGNLASIKAARTDTRTSGTTADDYDLFSLNRESVQNGAGGTTTAAGAVLRIENVATQTAGTLTDTVKGIELVMDADGTGDALFIDSNAATAIALNIDSEATTADLVNLDGSVLTTGNLIQGTVTNTVNTDTALINVTGTALDAATLVKFLELSTTAANDVDVALIHIERGTNDARIVFDEGLDQWMLDQGAGAGLVAITTGGSLTLQNVYDNDANGSNANITLSADDDSIVINNPSSSGTDSAFALQIDQNATGVIALDIDAENTTADIINISAAPLTSGIALDIPDLDALTTGRGLNITSNSADASSRVLAQVTNINTAATGTTVFQVEQGAASRAMFINQDGNGASLEIDSEATSANVIDFIAPTTTTGNVIDVADADSLTTGKIANFVSNSADTSTRTLTQITNDNTLATGATVLGIQQDAAQRAVFLDQNGNAVALEIDSEATSADVINIDTPATTTGIVFDANADALTTGAVVQLSSSSNVLTSGELLDLDHAVSSSGLSDKSGNLASVASSRTSTSTLATVSDDYDVFSLSRTSVQNGVGGLLLAAGAVLRIENVATQTAGTLTDTVKGIELVMDADGSGDALFIDSNAATAIALNIDSEATTADIINISAVPLTTGIALDIPDLDALTTGKGLNIVSNSANTSTRTLTQITNDNTAATGTTALSIQQDAAQRAMFLDQNADAVTLEIDSEATTANVIDVLTPTTTTGTVLDISDANSLTTGSIANFTSNSSSASTRYLVIIGNLSTSATDARTLLLDQDANAVTFEIDSEATSANVIDVITPVTTTGTVLDISDADSLTTGFIANFVSNSSSTSTRTLTQITNDNTLATGATVLGIQQDAAQRALFLDQNGNAVALDIDAENTSADAINLSVAVQTTGIALDIPDADLLTTGKGINIASGSEAISSGELITAALTSSGSANTAKTGALASVAASRTDTRTSGTTADDYDLFSLSRTSVQNGAGGTTTAAGAVLRIENVATQTAGTLTDTVRGIELVMDADGTGDAIFIDSNAANAIALNIDSEATTVNVVDIQPTVLTTGTALDIGDADALTTGKIANFVSNSASTSTRTLTQITNDNTLATGATVLGIQQDAAQRAVFLDQNANGISLEIDSEATTAHVLAMDGTLLTTGDALRITVDNSMTTGMAIRVFGGADGTTDVFDVDANGSVTNAGTLVSSSVIYGLSGFYSYGQIDGGTDGDGVVTEVVAGACSDAAFTTDTNGLICIDSTNGRFYFRYGGAWHYAAQTAGFQVPNYETEGLAVGDYVIGKLDQRLSDGALHGVYVKYDAAEQLSSLLPDTRAFRETDARLAALVSQVGGLDERVAGLQRAIDELASQYGTSSGTPPTPPAAGGPVIIEQAPAPLTSLERFTIGEAVLGTARVSGDLAVLGALTVQGSVVLEGPVEFKNAAVFAALTTFKDLVKFERETHFVGEVTFEGDAVFAGRPVFNADTAGFATVRSGSDRVTVTFDRAYAVMPVVNATLAHQLPVDGQVSPEELEVKRLEQERRITELLAGDIRYAVTVVSLQGFEIRLNRPATTDVQFSWTAVAVRDAKNFEGTAPAAAAAVPEAPASLKFEDPVSGSSVSQRSSLVPLGTVTVLGNELGYAHVRELGSAASSVIDRLEVGEVYSYVASVEGWYQIDLGGGVLGWVSSDDVAAVAGAVSVSATP